MRATRKKLQQMICLLLTVTMLVSALPFGVFAEDFDGVTEIPPSYGVGYDGEYENSYDLESTLPEYDYNDEEEYNYEDEYEYEVEYEYEEEYDYEYEYKDAVPVLQVLPILPAIGVMPLSMATVNDFDGLVAAIADPSVSEIFVDGIINLTQTAAINRPVGGSLTISGGELNAVFSGVNPPSTAIVPAISILGGAVTLQDILITNNGSGNIVGIDVQGSGAELYINSGTVISGFTNSGVRAGNNAQVTMIGGSITDNQAFSGGGVNIESGAIFIIEDGEIYANASTGTQILLGGGGGVFATGIGTIFEMSNSAVVRDNMASNGAGVQVQGGATFIMINGAIHDNVAAIGGGGVNIQGDATIFTMINGEIYYNEVTGVNGGGGVRVAREATFTMEGGAIHGNDIVSPVGPGAGVRVYADAIFIMADGIIHDNAAIGSGGGVSAHSSSIFTMESGLIHDNNANVGGGVHIAGNSVFTMEDGLIYDNNATNGGGVALMTGAVFTMEDGVIHDNAASLYGGGVHITTNTTFVMEDGVIHSNTATSGGGVRVLNAANATTTAIFIMEDGVIRDNEANVNGGGVLVQVVGAIFTMEDGAIYDNQAGNNGGGVHVQGNAVFTMEDGVIRGNEANSGGGVNLQIGQSTFTMLDGEIYNNTALGTAGLTGGGGVNIFNGTFTKEDGVIRDNHANNNGGGVQLHIGTIFDMNDGVIRDNEADGNGGGVFTRAAFTMESGMIADNGATYGGGVYVTLAGTFVAEGTSCLVNNVAAMDGGAIFTELFLYESPLLLMGEYTNLIIENTVTFANNTAQVAYEPPVNADDLTNIEFVDTSVFDQPLNNYDINFRIIHPTITKAAYPETVLRGDTVEYTLTINTEGMSGANFQNIKIVDVLDNRLQFNAGSVVIASANDWSYSFNAASNTITIFDIELNYDNGYAETVTITFIVTVSEDAPYGEIPNTAVIYNWDGTAIDDDATITVVPDESGNGNGNVGGGTGTGGGNATGGGSTTDPGTQHRPRPVPSIEQPYSPIDPMPIAHVHHAYLIGYEDGLIRPNASITRAETSTIFFRLISDEHRAGIWTQVNPFPDVQLEIWYNNAVSTMANGGLLEGYPDKYFRPSQAITRAEFAAIAARFMGYGHVTDLSGGAFDDIAGHWAESAINVASANGWIRGYGDGTFRPDQPITRAEVAALVNRLLHRLPESPSGLLDGMIEWPDNMNVNAWYYLYIQEATNSHYHEMKADGVHETWTALIEPREWWRLERPDSAPRDILQSHAGMHIWGDR